MRGLTEEENATLNRRLAGLDQFFQESVPVLTDFVQRLELPEPNMVFREADRYIAPIDEWMKDQVIHPEDRIWILTRIGYFIGEFLVQRFGGYWLVDEDPDSPYFLHYVVGRFSRSPQPHMKVSPFALADYFVSEPPGRSLLSVIHRIEEELKQR